MYGIGSLFTLLRNWVGFLPHRALGWNKKNFMVRLMTEVMKRFEVR